jgi:hypothetical protein
MRAWLRAASAVLAFVLLAAPSPKPFRPVPPTAAVADSLIRDGETHFAHLWQLTFGGQNAEAYWSGDGTRFIWQWTRDEWPCDQQYVMDLRTGARTLVSTGKGRTTCGYFYDHDARVLFASTHATADTCPAARHDAWLHVGDLPVVRALDGEARRHRPASSHEPRRLRRRGHGERRWPLARENTVERISKTRS